MMAYPNTLLMCCPTGDGGASLVLVSEEKLKTLSDDQRMKAAKRALAYAASVGVTSVQHMDASYADIAIYAELLQRGELTTRIYAAPLITHVEDQATIGVRHAFGGPYLRIGAVKAFADGSLGSARQAQKRSTIPVLMRGSCWVELKTLVCR